MRGRTPRSALKLSRDVTSKVVDDEEQLCPCQKRRTSPRRSSADRLVVSPPSSPIPEDVLDALAARRNSKLIPADEGEATPVVEPGVDSWNPGPS